jgi:hypothetical protein
MWILACLCSNGKKYAKGVQATFPVKSTRPIIECKYARKPERMI